MFSFPDFTRDYENRLMSVVITRGDKTFKVNFAYNGDGQRIYKEVKGPDDQVESKILYIRNSFGEVVAEHSLDLSSNIYHLTSSYVFGNGKRILSLTSADTKTYYLSDIFGSNSLLTDKDGNPTMLTKYDEFGNTYYEWSLTSNIDHLASSSYKYTGKPFDSEIGLYYYGARYYNPMWGRWVSRDSLAGESSRSQSLNRMIYVENNPLVRIDIFGEETESLDVGFSGGFGVPPLFSCAGGGTFSIVWDDKGNLGVQYTAYVGPILGFDLAPLGIGVTKTSADKIHDLSGYGVNYGATNEQGLGLALLSPIALDSEGNLQFTRDWEGIALNTSLGLGLEGHLYYSYTVTLFTTTISEMINENTGFDRSLIMDPDFQKRMIEHMKMIEDAPQKIKEAHQKVNELTDKMNNNKKKDGE